MLNSSILASTICCKFVNEYGSNTIYSIENKSNLSLSDKSYMMSNTFEIPIKMSFEPGRFAKFKS